MPYHSAVAIGDRAVTLGGPEPTLPALLGHLQEKAIMGATGGCSKQGEAVRGMVLQLLFPHGGPGHRSPLQQAQVSRGCPLSLLAGCTGFFIANLKDHRRLC
jgi:hypothetical protein